LGGLFAVTLSSCNQNEPPPPREYSNLTIFHVNDQHGRLENFAKIKHIIDQQRQNNTVLLVSAGDIFSGNPVVDNYPDKGLPIIDIMNQTGFDITVIGNHEFDYGEATLQNRIDQSSFKWVCANVNMANSIIDQPPAYETISVDDLKITFLGLIETNGAPGTIPSAHPGKMQNVIFDRPENVVDQYSEIKEQENSDLYVALTHLGHDSFDPSVLGDFDLAANYPYFDLIIGGHTNLLLDTVVNDIPIFMAGFNLDYLGKISISIFEKAIADISFELINLNAYENFDDNILAAIEEYNDFFPDLDDVIGSSEIHHRRWREVGCFYTYAMQSQLNVDISFQNSGGIRDDLRQGDITKRDIYAIDPFNNGTLIYTMTVKEVKNLLKGINMGLYYSGIMIEKQNDNVVIKDEAGNVYDDSDILTLGINDFIPAIRGNFFPPNPDVLPKTTTEVIIEYLENNSASVNYPECSRYFRY
jgi:2',3'-cyclic-nucleotide 2'-phosphodiesterase (5'-nucleotidase family)